MKTVILRKQIALTVTIGQLRELPHRHNNPICFLKITCHYVHVHFEIPGHPGGENVARLLESKILGHTIIQKNFWTQTKIIQGPIKKN